MPSLCTAHKTNLQFTDTHRQSCSLHTSCYLRGRSSTRLENYENYIKDRKESAENKTSDSEGNIPTTSVLVEMLAGSEKHARQTSFVSDQRVDLNNTDFAGIEARLNSLDAVDFVVENAKDVREDEKKPHQNNDVLSDVDFVEEVNLDGPLTPKDLSGKAEDGRRVRLHGSSDPSVPMSAVPCHGCGAMLHCRDPGIPGFLPAEKFLSVPVSELHDIPCQRCHMLSAFNVALDVSVSEDEYENVMIQTCDERSLALVVVDLTDLPASLYGSIAQLVGTRRQVYVVGNKVDLLPKDAPQYLRRVEEYVRQLCISVNLRQRPQHVALVSAKTGFGIEALITRLLQDWSRRGDVYILGCTNAGKSTLFNTLLTSDYCSVSARDIIQRATTSTWPGTTLSLLKFPIFNPRAAVLYERLQRLKQDKAEHPKQYERQKSIVQGQGRGTLRGHVGATCLTPRQRALEVRLQKNGCLLEPTYTYNETEQTVVSPPSAKEKLMHDIKADTAGYEEKNTFKRWCYDTPGLINPQQIINLLTQAELSALLSTRIISPRTYTVNPSQVMYISGLARIDYVKGADRMLFTVFAAEGVQIHVLDAEQADDFFQENIGSPVFGVPLGDRQRLDRIPSLVGSEFNVDGIGWQQSAADVVLSSIGWVSVTAGLGESVTLRAYTPGARGCVLRTPALLCYAVTQRQRRRESPQLPEK